MRQCIWTKWPFLPSASTWTPRTTRGTLKGGHIHILATLQKLHLSSLHTKAHWQNDSDFLSFCYTFLNHGYHFWGARVLCFFLFFWEKTFNHKIITWLFISFLFKNIYIYYQTDLHKKYYIKFVVLSFTDYYYYFFFTFRWNLSHRLRHTSHDFDWLDWNDPTRCDIFQNHKRAVSAWIF